MVTMM